MGDRARRDINIAFGFDGRGNRGSLCSSKAEEKHA